MSMRRVKFVLLCVLSLCYGQAVMGSSLLDTQRIVVNFEVDRAELNKGAIQSLAAKLEGIDLKRVASVLVDAHTDSDGSEGYNITLSQRRAMSVESWLIASGIDSALISLSWDGENRPVSSNATASGKRENRRATVTFIIGRPLRLVSGTIADSIGTGLEAKVVIRGKEFVDSVQTDSAGNFRISVPDSAVLMAEFFSPGYIYESEMFNSSRTHDLEMSLRPIERGVRFRLHRFYFIGNKDVLLSTSVPELQRLLRFMELNPTVVIAIEGHMNMPNRPKVSEDSWEYDLSLRRARRVHDYLLDQGIRQMRITYEGFGNWNMMYPKATREEQMRFNRRVEIRIVDY